MSFMEERINAVLLTSSILFGPLELKRVFPSNDLIKLSHINEKSGYSLLSSVIASLTVD